MNDKSKRAYESLRNLKKIYKEQKPFLKRDIQERVESWIKLVPKIIKNPNIPFYTEGNQIYHHCAHPPIKEGDIPIPYTQEEINMLNEIEQYPYLKMGNPKSDFCLYCGRDLKEIRNPSDPRTKPRDVDKYCSDDCKSYRGKKNSRRKILGSSIIVWGKNKEGRNFVKAISHQDKNSIIEDLPTKNRRTS